MPLPDLLSVFNAQPGATLLLSPEWVIVGASDDYLAATLTDRATIVGQFIFDAFPDNPETPEANGVANVRAALTQVLATKQPHDMAPQHYDVPDRTRPGRFVERHWKPRHTPVLDAAGQVQFIIQSVQDVTASRLAERLLREAQAAGQEARAEVELQRQRFYEVLMALPAQVATYHGPDHVYRFVNEAYCRYFPAQALPGRSLREVLPGIEAQGMLAVMDRVYQTGEPRYLHELEVWLDFSGSGQPRQLFLNVLFHPLRDTQGRVDGLLDFSYDVTEQVHARQQVLDANQALSAANQQLTRTNADLDTFIYTASHDLKAPITNIEGLLTALGEHLPEAARQAEPVPHLFHLMQGAVERFQFTIDQLSDITKLQQAQQQPAEAVDLAALIEAVRLDLAPLLAAAGAQLTVAVAESPTVRFAPKNLRSIVYNLLSNAIKYGHPDRPPVVQARCRPGIPGTVVLEVKDNGLGLSESQQGKLFGLFQRLHTHVEGSGVGLYMVKKIVDNAGGTIAVHSQAGLGTTFTVTLPG